LTEAAFVRDVEKSSSHQLSQNETSEMAFKAYRQVPRLIQSHGELHFRAVLVLIETVGGGSDGTRFKQRTGGKPGVECWAFSQSKKEIRDD
jgi:hypothetical protein